jgi:prepilin peptidase CpaA
MLPPLHALAVLISLPIIGYDVYARRVPNAVLVAGLLSGACWLAWSLSPSMAIDASLGLVLGLISMLPFYVMRWMGAGDVKFFAVLGFLMGWRLLLPVWIAASLLSGLHALFVLATRTTWYPQLVSRDLPSRLGLQALVQRSMLARQGREGLPFAAHLGIAAIFVVMVYAP